MPPKRKQNGTVTKKAKKNDTTQENVSLKQDSITTKSSLSNPSQTTTLPRMEDIKNAFLEQNVVNLDAVVRELEGSQLQGLFDEYKQKMEIRVSKSDQLIKKLTEENKRIAELEAKIAELETKVSTQKTIQSPIKKKPINNEELNTELEQIGIIFDMLEVITGLRIQNLEEDEQSIYFDMQHSNNGGLNIDYKLVISKLVTETPEILYVPQFHTEHVGQLEKILPDYFFEQIRFPYDTLPQFYQKMKRALDKGL